MHDMVMLKARKKALEELRRKMLEMELAEKHEDASGEPPEEKALEEQEMGLSKSVLSALDDELASEKEDDPSCETVDPLEERKAFMKMGNGRRPERRRDKAMVIVSVSKQKPQVGGAAKMKL